MVEDAWTKHMKYITDSYFGNFDSKSKNGGNGLNRETRHSVRHDLSKGVRIWCPPRTRNAEELSLVRSREVVENGRTRHPLLSSQADSGADEYLKLSNTRYLMWDRLCNIPPKLKLSFIWGFMACRNWQMWVKIETADAESKR